jgi:type I restriction enzyme M protein
MGRDFSNREPVRGAGHESNNPASGNRLGPEARPSLDKAPLERLVDIISNIGFKGSPAKSKDVVGRVYEYLLGNLASAEVKGGGEFYTPQCAAQALVAVLEPPTGRVFDPCCGSVGMFVSSGELFECTALVDNGLHRNS